MYIAGSTVTTVKILKLCFASRVTILTICSYNTTTFDTWKHNVIHYCQNIQPLTNQPQPDPCTPTEDALNFSFIWSNEPKSLLIASISTPKNYKLPVLQFATHIIFFSWHSMWKYVLRLRTITHQPVQFELYSAYAKSSGKKQSRHVNILGHHAFSL